MIKRHEYHIKMYKEYTIDIKIDDSVSTLKEQFSFKEADIAKVIGIYENNKEIIDKRNIYCTYSAVMQMIVFASQISSPLNNFRDWINNTIDELVMNKLHILKKTS